LYKAQTNKQNKNGYDVWISSGGLFWDNCKFFAQQQILLQLPLKMKTPKLNSIFIIFTYPQT